MTAVWTSIVVLAVANFVIKAVGPVFLGGRELPRPVLDVIALLAPAILAGLVLVGTFSEDGRLKLDSQAVGVAVSGVAFVARLPMLAAIALGAIAAALLRAVG
jgi:uncharacterized membrane protein